MISAKKLKPLLKDYDAGMTYKELAEKYNISLNAVFKTVHQYGNPRVRRYGEDTVNKVKYLYVEQNKSLTEVSLEMDMTVNQIRGIIHRYDIIKSRPERIKPYEDFSKPINTVIDPVYYPEKTIPKKVVVVRGKQYQDVSEYYGL